MSEIIRIGSADGISQTEQFALQRIQFAYKILILYPGHKGPAYHRTDRIFALGFNRNAQKPNQVVSFDIKDPDKWLDSIRASATMRGLVELPKIEGDDQKVIWFGPQLTDKEELLEANSRQLSGLALGSNVDPKVAKAQGPKTSTLLLRYPHPKKREKLEPEQMAHPMITRKPSPRARDKEGRELPLTPENQFSRFTTPRTAPKATRPKPPEDIASLLSRPGMKRSDPSFLEEQKN